MMTNTSTSQEAARDAECSTTIRYLLVSLLVFCALGVLLFGTVAAHSAAVSRRPKQRVAPPSPAGIQHRSPAVAAEANDPLRELELLTGGFGSASGVQRETGRSTRYTVHIRLPNGNEQLIPIAAPPGGLQLEMRDMTGDKTANDLVLRPALVHWPLIVLLNDNHDHFTEVISATLPSCMDSGSRLSGSQQVPDTAALVSFSSKAGASANRQRLLVPKPQQGLLFPFMQSSTNEMERISISGRAPPAKI